MDVFYLLRWLHIIGGTVLLGTGAGIAFFMLLSHRTGNPHIVAHTASVVVVADYVFTASAVVLQPVTGVLLALQMGWPLGQGWLLASIGLYVLTGACWLPVVRIQIHMRDLARGAVAANTPLPASYYRLFRSWVLLGIPAFVAVLLILWLMVARPSLVFI
ncbi:MAG: DUF2269 domain-containing protein [Gammaproteobacteria bacterium]